MFVWLLPVLKKVFAWLKVLLIRFLNKNLLMQLFRAHAEIKKIVAWQKMIAREMNVELKTIHDDTYDWKDWEKSADAFLTDDLVRKRVYRQIKLHVMSDLQ